MKSYLDKAVWVCDDKDNIIAPAERRIIYVVSPNEMDKDIDKAYKIKLKDFIPIIQFLKNKDEQLLYEKYSLYPIIGMKNAQKHFKFPPNHPVRNMLYGMCDIIPDLYIPISSFHEYFQQMKHASFLELCASLGAKEIYLEFAEIEGTSYQFDSSSKIPTQLGNLGLDLSINGGINKNVNGKLAYRFNARNKDIKEYESEWMISEPTWKSLKKMRIKNHVESFRAEFNYSDDFGINLKVAAKCNNYGISIGGEFKEIKNIMLKYNVIFW
jgi:hypothetical protein